MPLDSTGINTIMFFKSNPPEGKRQYIKTFVYKAPDDNAGLSPTLMAHILLKVGNEIKDEGWDDVWVEAQSTKDSFTMRLTGVKLNG